MNVLLVSQCNKNALVETRRILDQYAERCGERTWQTPITAAGLDTLRRLLRKSARKNTAVACHWIRGKDHSELLWIVGDASRFNEQGAVPTNRTQRDVLRSGDENDWHTGEDIRLLAALAGLMHDLGKACRAFQQRLRGTRQERNLYRHEWISLRLFQAFVGDDNDMEWLERLADPGGENEECWLNRLQRDGLDAETAPPFHDLPPLAAAVGWLVLTHHRLPLKPAERDSSGYRPPWGSARPDLQAEELRDLPEAIQADWNEIHNAGEPDEIAPYWSFDHDLPVVTRQWRERASHLAQRLLERQRHHSGNPLDNPYVMHLARLCLMLADHHYSSLEESGSRVSGDPDYPLYANTYRDTGAFKQTLDEHLLGVEKHSGVVARTLPSLVDHLPRLGRHKGFRKRSTDRRFQWQDKAFDLAKSIRERSERQGFFGINMASTGCGKTLANGRILYALADPQKGARFNLALGLRTLTLQTGQVYGERLNLGEDELAVRVGGSASRALFDYYEQKAERTGSASSQALMEEDGHVVFEGSFDSHPVLRRLGEESHAGSLIAAPVLACTVDHLVPATEGIRGGRQIAPMLRLMSSDLVLDEIDDFALEDLPALTRLVHWAGLLGSRVLLSSATLPPALVQGLFDAYRDGRSHYQENRGETGRPVEICCAWFDENDRQQSDCSDGEGFVAAHQRFAERRHQRLSRAPVRRRGGLASMEGLGKRPESIRAALAERLRDHAEKLHARYHSVDPYSGKRVSFGLIRMANIDPIFDVALSLFELGGAEGQRIHLCVYHSQHPVLVRSEIEHCLDQTLDRREENAVFDRWDVRHKLDQRPEDDHLFIVLGSPVTEVGRDHDYDWAVVEPSSQRSMIQLAGRVWRHRQMECATPNMVLLDTNLKHLERPNAPAFCRPGFEGSGEWSLRSHALEDLLRVEELESIDARPRIQEPDPLSPRDYLVDLEHARLRDQMIPRAVKPLSAREQRVMKKPPVPPLGAHSWYQMPRAHLAGILPHCQPFRRSTGEQVELVLLPDESGDTCTLHQIWEGKGKSPDLYLPLEQSALTRVDLDRRMGERINTWAVPNYLETLAAVAEERDMPLEAAAKRFGTVTVRNSQQGWRFHAALGFAKHG